MHIKVTQNPVVERVNVPFPDLAKLPSELQSDGVFARFSRFHRGKPDGNQDSREFELSSRAKLCIYQ
jgi:hypothetical protein